MALDPEPETFQPVIEDGITSPFGVTVIPYEPDFDGDDGDDQMEEEEIQVDVMRTVDPQRAYVRIPTKPVRSLDHHGQGWGCVYFGYVVHRVPGGGGSDAASIPTFQAPTPDTVQYVAIKRLRKAVVQRYLKVGGHENPYVELGRMQQYGDNIHVLGCLEALQDETFLYIITPYCEIGSLVDCIPWQQRGMILEDQARMYFEQLLENVRYLQERGICHRDLSPDNCMVYRGRLVLTDLAMSFRVPQPREGENGQGPVMVKPRGWYGKRSYLPPEVWIGWPFDPYACDLWSSILVLFNLLTGEFLYEEPTPENIKFKYFVLARGLSRTPMNEQLMEMLMTEMNNVREKERDTIDRTIRKILQLSPEVRELLENVFKMTPHERWTLVQVEECTWIQQYRQQFQQAQQPL